MSITEQERQNKKALAERRRNLTGENPNGFKSFTLDGKRHRLDPVVPARLIQMHVALQRVSMSDDEVRAGLRRVIEATVRELKGPVGWTPTMIKQACDYAVKCHRDNQNLYRRVTMGMKRK